MRLVTTPGVRTRSRTAGRSQSCSPATPDKASGLRAGSGDRSPN